MTSTHPDPVYTSNADIDFQALSMLDADFAAILNNNKGRFDWKNGAHVKQLTKSVLKRDFDLQIELPDDRLCPPIPVRYNYVRWIQDLLDSSSPSSSPDLNRRIIGLDIGVGSSNIYSLLHLRTRPSYLMCGTDIDETNFTYATKNTALNDFSDRMRLCLIDEASKNTLIPLDRLQVPHLDFTMCNPPFFATMQEMQDSLSGASKGGVKPSAACTGAEVEMVTEGGDLGFVLKMLAESLVLREKVRWYSSMLGKLESLKKVVERIKEAGVENWTVGSLASSDAKTKRWVVAWSFGDWRPGNEVSRRDFNMKEYTPFPTTYTIPLSQPSTVQTARITTSLHQFLSSLDLKYSFLPPSVTTTNTTTTTTITGSASENVWSRSARRKASKKVPSGTNSKSMTEDQREREGTGGREDTVALSFKIIITDEQIDTHWVRGRDRVLWESWCGAVHRVVRSASAV